MQARGVVEMTINNKQCLAASAGPSARLVLTPSAKLTSPSRTLLPEAGAFSSSPCQTILAPAAACSLRNVAAASSNANAAPTTTSAAPTPVTAPVQAVLFDMDGVLCNSEIVSRKAAAEVMAELYGLTVDPAEFIPYTGTGEANFLGGVARKYGAPFEVESCKAKFFEIYMAKYAVPGAGIGYAGARELVEACRAAGLRTAVASSADLVKVHANLGAADIPLDIFDAIVSADAFERLKPFPDIFLAAAAQLGVHPASCVVIEDALAGVEAARAAGMRVVGVTTTMQPDAMVGAAPDAVLPQISSISVGVLVGLTLREGGEAAIAEAKAKSSIRATPAALPNELRPVSTSSSSNGGVQDWLNEWVHLPAGYRTSRRDALKFLSLGGALGSGYVTLTRAKELPSFKRIVLGLHLPIFIQLFIVGYVAVAWEFWTKSLSYASPKALLNALLPRAGPSINSAGDAPGSRVAAFKRFIADLERRGTAEMVPEFPAGADWLNAPPLRLDRELRGKVLLLDFWTLCCINCQHVLPDLAYIEDKFAGSAVSVVGVHSAKFDNEQDTAAIRAAVLRYDIRHPVINDAGMALWRALGISSWPTFAVVAPTGRLLLALPGEGHRQDVEDIIAAALDYYGEQGLLDATPVPMSLEKDKDPAMAASPLRFPGKLAVDPSSSRLFISDSGNHRIVVTNLEGKFLAAVGGNGPGLRDGDAATAAFNRPQGLVYDAQLDCLYVCDTENHAVREIDFAQRGRVRTIVGDGQQGFDYVGGRAGSAQRLSSPWDAVLVRGGDGSSSSSVLVVAMAGLHQIWRVDVESGNAAPVSGTGAERNQNGPTGASSAWAQPSGLALFPGGAALVVADSESSSIRRMDLATGGASACVGGDRLFSDNLFKFGDVDGAGASALLQHPLAVATDPSPTPSSSSSSPTTVYVADSYNHRIKALEPEACSIATVAGSGLAGSADGKGSAAQLSEPGGLAVEAGGRRVWVADTNNHVIRVLDPRTGVLSTLKLKSVPPPAVSPDAAPAWTGAGAAGVPPGAAFVRVAEPVAPGKGKLQVAIRLPEGYHVTQGANSRFVASSSADAVVFSPTKGSVQDAGVAATAELSFDATGAAAGTSLLVVCTVFFCQDRSVCLYRDVAFDILVDPEKAGQPSRTVDLTYAIPAL